jgi:hypothetical protein
VKSKNIGSGVMTNDVQIIFAANNLRRVNFGDQDFFAFRVWSGKKISERVDDTTATASHDRVRILTVNRTIFPGKITSTIELIAR